MVNRISAPIAFDLKAVDVMHYLFDKFPCRFMFLIMVLNSLKKYNDLKSELELPKGICAPENIATCVRHSCFVVNSSSCYFCRLKWYCRAITLHITCASRSRNLLSKACTR